MSNGDVHILNGFSDMLNVENIKPGVDIRDLERKMINGGIIQKVKDPQDKFNEEMRNTAKKLGIDFSEFDKSAKVAQNAPIVPSFAPQYGGSDSNLISHFGQPDNGSDTDTASSKSASDDERDEPTSTNIMGDIDRDDNSNSRSKYEDDDEPSLSSYRLSEQYNRTNMSLTDRTKEEERRQHIRSVNSEMGVENDFSLEKEKREDMKCYMLEEIDSLMFSLQEEDIDLSRIPKVDKNTTYEDIELVLKMLRHKSDRVRYCSLAEEFMLFGAVGLEELFDGKRTWFGKYKPDLTGWHNHVNVKLRRMRHDTSTLVGTIMHDYNIGPGARLLFELIPNAVLYSKNRRIQHGSPSLYTDEEMAQANNRIRDI